MVTSVIALVWPQLAALKKYEFKTSYIQSAEQLSCICLIEQAGPGEAGETLSIQARGSDKSPGPLFVPSKIER